MDDLAVHDDQMALRRHIRVAVLAGVHAGYIHREADQCLLLRLLGNRLQTALADEKRDLVLKRTLETDIRLVRFEDGVIEFAPAAGASVNLAADLGKKLQEWTGRRWLVAVSSQQGQETLREVSDRETAQVLADVTANRVVRAVLDAFPGARVVDVRDPVAEALAARGDDDLPLDDSFDFTMLDDDND
ncbi:MAG: hypothetical protein NTZ22_02780 [Hyphomicrobiales bacterium]|nr:hypothetical protein [Hyphomicrobiales bacterium]